MRSHVALILVLAWAPALSAQSITLPAAFRCDFEAGDGRALSADATDRKTAELVHDVIFTQISTSSGTALQVQDTGETPLTLATAGSDTVHLMDAAPTGTVTLTTIFLTTRREVDGGGFTYPVYRAVMSRHNAAYRGVAEAFQAYGSCKGVR